jgi:ABC-2 type transport system permease protein
MRSVPFSPGRALRRFGFRQTLRSALIIGALSGFMLVGQGYAYQKSYTDAAAQTKFATSLSSTPALGLLYGDSKNLTAGTKGYMVYRVAGFMALITSVWGLLTATRLLRGSEEDDRWEPLRVGAVTARAATTQVMTGFGFAWVAACVAGTLVTLSLASSLQLPLHMALVMNLMIFLPGLLFATVGLFTSQLALTRQRAVIYGLLPLLSFFLLRGVANTAIQLHWLMAVTPFGWMELVNPVLGAQNWWLALPLAWSGLFVGLGIGLSQRDLGSSIIHQSDTTRPHYWLLGSGWQLALRQNILLFAAWAGGALTVAALIAGLSTIAVNATADSKNLSHSIGALAGNGKDIRLAFLGAGFVFLVMILMLLATTIIGAIRRDEAKQYLDNILVQPHRRTTWLASRLLLGWAVIVLIALLAGLVTYLIATSQTIRLDFGKVMATSVCLVGTVGFLGGLGALIYGLKPRLAGLAMYVILGWSFLITLLASVLHLSSSLLHSSLFYYTSFNLAAWPDWQTFSLMILLCLTMAGCGIIAFAKRDTITE